MRGKRKQKDIQGSMSDFKRRIVRAVGDIFPRSDSVAKKARTRSGASSWQQIFEPFLISGFSDELKSRYFVEI